MLTHLQSTHPLNLPPLTAEQSFDPTHPSSQSLHYDPPLSPVIVLPPINSFPGDLMENGNNGLLIFDLKVG